jgi:(2Fe-2S) ferredoxin/ubiquinone/menaquinone biosynthesis C-methylase UbiE
MEPFRYHVFICDQQKPEGVPGCAASGSAKVIEALRAAVAREGLNNEVQITTCGSLGLCGWGPNMVVYPEGVWYAGVTAADADEIVGVHFKQGRVVQRLAKTDPAELFGEICRNRDKFWAGMRAREAVGALPEPLAQSVRGFQESRVILTAIELDLFTAVGEGATPAQVAARIDAEARATEMLMNALVAVQLLTKRDGTFANTPIAARFLVSNLPDSHRMALMHTAHIWKRWSTLTEAVRAGTAVASGETPERGEEWTQAFIAAMHRNAAERAQLVVGAVGAEGVARMLDVGGGSGAYSIAFAKANEKLHADLLDLPGVLPIAQGHIEQAGLAARVHTRPADLRSGPLGSGYDLAFVSAICHMLSVVENRDLLRRCWRALAPGGRLVIQDFILEPDKTAPKSAALFSLNMLVGTKEGASYSEPEYAEWMREAGFAEVRRVRLPGPTGLMIGSRR